MKELQVPSRPASGERRPPIRLLLADDDADLRARVAARVHGLDESVAVYEADDGAEAVQLGLQLRPQLALLDADLPVLGGVDAALTLRELEPAMRLGVHTDDPRTHREQARAHRLPLFDKVELEHAVGWLEAQVRACSAGRPRRQLRRLRSLECSACGYGVMCAGAPDRCPMCQVEDGWVHGPSPRRELEGVT